MQKFINDMNLELFYLKNGQEVNSFSFDFLILSFSDTLGTGVRDTLKNVTDSHCSAL
jgi:hypothetical protein